MRNLAKYFLALGVMGTGFYAALQHRHPDRDVTDQVAAVRTPADGPSAGSRQPPAGDSERPLPVAALADVDRLPLLGSDQAMAKVRPTGNEVATVRKQPTLRDDDLAGKSEAAVSSENSGLNSAPQDAKKQAAAKPPHKKPNSKKTGTAKPPDYEPTDGATGRTNDRFKAEAKRPTSQAGLAPDNDFVPPDFAREYQPYSEHFQSGLESSTAGQGESLQENVAAASPSADQRNPSKASPTTEPRRHRIVEGDTLRRLAEKYLGSRERYLELFQANTDVLFDPQFIPIGVEIVIPDRTTIVAQAAAEPATAGDSNSHSTPEDYAAPDDWFSIPAVDAK